MGYRADVKYIEIYTQKKRKREVSSFYSLLIKRNLL